jgi:glutathione S-transferase
MTQPLTIIGSYISPYVRKVLACLQLKRLPYEIDPISPFFGSDEFQHLSPLRRVPVLIDGDFAMSDSSVICAYLDEAYPGHPLLPADPKERARARWFEEYADTRLGEVLIWSFFYQKVVRPMVWGEPGDEARIEKSLDEEIPTTLDYLERELPQDGFLFGEIGVADISIASFFRNAAYGGFTVDSSRWPKAAAFIQRTLAHDSLSSFVPFEDVLMRVDVRARRQALLEAGAPLTAQTLGTREPRSGMMRL